MICPRTKGKQTTFKHQEKVKIDCTRNECGVEMLISRISLVITCYPRTFVQLSHVPFVVSGDPARLGGRSQDYLVIIECKSHFQLHRERERGLLEREGNTILDSKELKGDFISSLFSVEK